MSTDSPKVIATGHVVSIHYTLKNDAGDLLDSSSGGPPLPYLHGAGNIVPGLERALTGRGVGDSFAVLVEPEDGYGSREGPGPQAVPRDAFPDDVEFEEGMQFLAESPEGEVTPLWITQVDESQVWVDVAHPLAGERLNFEIEVMGIRLATEGEVEHGHPHGIDGDDDDDDEADDEEADEDDDDDDDEADDEEADQKA